MNSQSYARASLSGAPPDQSSSDKRAVLDAAKIGALWTVIGFGDAVLAMSMGAEPWRLFYIAGVVGVPAATLFFMPSRVALAMLIAVSLITVAGLAVIYVQGGGIIAPVMMLLNIAFVGVFARGFRAASRLAKQAGA
ncbi:MAG: hypothetical protein AAGA09_03175 [Pseudomonadota bacterium]